MNSEQITHDQLIDIGRKWLIKPYSACAPYGHCGCAVVLSELSANTWMAEIPDIIGFCTRKTILIECKASRADFNADKNKVFRKLPEMALGNQRWYLAPIGIIPAEKVPDKWGLLEVSGGKVQITKRAELQERNYQSEINMLLSTMRRLNIQPDGHVGIKKYDLPEDLGFKPSKKRATFYIGGQDEQ